MRCPAHPDRVADRACCVCGAWSCASCAPDHPGLGGPACARCEAAVPRSSPAPPRRPPWRSLLALAAVGGVAAAVVIRARSPEVRSRQAWLAVERVGEALEAFDAAQGDYPDRLDELVPVQLKAVPRDPWRRGQPLGYLAAPGNPDGRILYSVGPDGIDQGGSPRDLLTGAGDLAYPVR